MNIAIKQTNNHGYVALITVLVVSAVLVGVVLTSSLRGVAGAKGALAMKKGTEARVAASGCWEQALWQIMSDPSYVGESMAMGQANCEIDVATNGSSRTVSIVSTILGPPSYVRRVGGEVELTGQTIRVMSYTE